MVGMLVAIEVIRIEWIAELHVPASAPTAAQHSTDIRGGGWGVTSYYHVAQSLGSITKVMPNSDSVCAVASGNWVHDHSAFQSSFCSCASDERQNVFDQLFKTH